MSQFASVDKIRNDISNLYIYAPAGVKTKWLGGLDKPEALRQAQLQERETVRQRYDKDLPFYWGAFVLVGP